MITIGYSTRESKPEFYEYLKKSSGVHKVQVIEKVNNGEKSLSQVYNEIINESENDIVVLCHDDIYFDTNNWGKKLVKNYDKNNFDIIGVAGTTSIPESGRWWEDMTKMSGIVNHEHEGRKWESKYSSSLLNSLQEVCLIDGVFISFNKNNIKHRFNESVEGFHFYDVYFSVENHLSGCKIGVTHDFRLTHRSIGMTNEKWEENRLKFVENFKDNLPIKLIPNIDYKMIDKEDDKEQYQLILQSTDTEKTKKLISSIGEKNVEIIIISNGENTEELKDIPNVSVIEGYFNSIGKNLSVIKWENNFVENIKKFVFLSTDNLEIKNDVFYHLTKVAKKEQNILGCVFPTVLNMDGTIFSSGLNLFLNGDKMGLMLNNQNRYYEIIQGYRKSYYGGLSNLFLTTKQNLINLDWFDLNLETEIVFTDFAFKLSNKGLSVFVDTNSLISLSSELDLEKFNSELQSSIGKNSQNENFRKNLKQIKR